MGFGGVHRTLRVGLLAVTGALTVWPAAAIREDVAHGGEATVSIISRVPPRNSANAASIRLDVKVVQIPVTVTDLWDRPVEGLNKTDFHLYEDNVEQKIVYLSSEDAPASMGLIFDASGSMRDKIDTSVTAIEQLFMTTQPGDEFLLVRFSDRPHLVSDFTEDIHELSEWLHSIRPGGWTALHDAIYLGIHKMKRARNARRALVILSDGGDNNSRYSAAEIRELVKEADVRVYSIGLALGLLQGSRLLERISEESGGRMIRVHKLEELPEAIEKLSRDLRSQYVLGYYSSNPVNDGKYRKIRVEVKQPDVHAAWRHGYYAPLQ